MHIAWLGKKSPFCGNVTYNRKITNALLERGYEVSFLHFAQEESHSENWPECPEVFLPFLYKSQAFTIPSPRSSKVLMRSLQELKPDLVHVSLTLSPLDFRLPEICQELNLPLIATFHSPFDSKLRTLKSSTQFLGYQLYAPFLAHYDGVIVFSRIQRDLLVRLGVPSEKLAVIPNGVEAEKYTPGHSHFKSQLQTQRLFVYQGRMATEKNVEALLRAWKHCSMGEDSKLVLVGNGPLSPSLRSADDEQQGIIWLGAIADEMRRVEILRAADAFILPSLVEGLSLSLLEAMSCGVACLATDAGADGEVLEDGAGVVLSTQRVTAQLKALLPLFRDHPELTTSLGQKGRQRVLERYTLSRNITQIEKLYTEVMNRKQIQLSV
ncbi:MAG: glycosyltransferase [Cyanobacteria bacterium QS_4_48_99]|nr:MAG: glycosyltransferase [Cyanobacteria bacterium QS_4_48_99]